MLETDAVDELVRRDAWSRTRLMAGARVSGRRGPLVLQSGVLDGLTGGA